jgi:hypothetical protein
MVIGKITSLGTLVIFGAIAVLFLKQASASSFGVAGQDVGSGLTGISSGITAIFGSFINPIKGLFDWAGTLFNFGNTEQSGQTANTYGNVRNIPTPNTSRVTSNTATENTIVNVGGSNQRQSTINFPSGGVSLPLSSQARSYYSSIGVSVT